MNRDITPDLQALKAHTHKSVMRRASDQSRSHAIRGWCSSQREEASSGSNKAARLVNRRLPNMLGATVLFTGIILLYL